MSDASRRERILGVAERLFAHYGPGKTTVADIARACGIGVGSVYLDFQSKEAILAALAQKNVSTVASRMKAAAAKGGRAPERLVAMLRARVDALYDLAEGSQHGCDLVRCRADRPTEAHAPGFGRDVRALLEAEIAAGIERGELRKVDPSGAVRLIELAFAALSPPGVFTISRKDALATTMGLATLVVGGLVAGALASAPPAEER